MECILCLAEDSRVNPMDRDCLALSLAVNHKQQSGQLIDALLSIPVDWNLKPALRAAIKKRSLSLVEKLLNDPRILSLETDLLELSLRSKSIAIHTLLARDPRIEEIKSRMPQ